MRLFEADDYPILQGWFQKRGMKAPPYSYLPKVGFIDDFYAAGFLIQTDTPIAVIDFIISNQSSNVAERADAVASVVSRLMAEAKRRGFKAIHCTTKFRSIGRLAKSFGFYPTGELNSYYREI